MPKNVKGGSKHKKQKNTNFDETITIILKEDDNQDYGHVIKMLGNNRVLLECEDQKERLGIIRGSMRKKQWINLNNIVLYCKREYEDEKVDIIFVYTSDMLNNNNELRNIYKKIKNSKENINNLVIKNDEEDDDDIFNLDEIQYNNEKDYII